jgi:hypothetical protein
MQFNSTTSEATKNNNRNFFATAAYFNAQLPAMSEAGLMGYYYMNKAANGLTNSDASAGASYLLNPTQSSPDSLEMSMSFLGISLNTSVESVETVFGNLMKKVKSTPGLTSYLIVLSQNELDLLASITSSSSVVGVNIRVGSRLLDRNALADQEAMAKTLRLYEQTGLQGIFTSGPGVRAVSVDENSVNPAWRTAFLHACTCLLLP